MNKKISIIYLFLTLNFLYSYSIVEPDKNLFGWKGKPIEVLKLFSSKVSNIAITGDLDSNLILKLQNLWPDANIIKDSNNPLFGEYPYSKENGPINLLLIGKSNLDIFKIRDILLNNRDLNTIYIDILNTDHTLLKSYIDTLNENEYIEVHNFYSNSSAYKIFVKTYLFAEEEKIQIFKQANFFDSYHRYFVPLQNLYFEIEKTATRHDSIKEDFIRKGLPYEYDINLIILDLIQKGSSVIDIGAHIGVHTHSMSKKTGPLGVVYAFEPDNILYLELINNLRINNCYNVIPISKCVAEEERLGMYAGFVCIDLYDQETLKEFKDKSKATAFDKNISRLSGLRTFIDENSKAECNITSTVAIDDYNINNLSLIKMDIEGFEYYALEGAKETILRELPAIIFECWVNVENHALSLLPWKENFDRIYYFLDQCNYDVYSIFNSDFIALPRLSNDKNINKYKRMLNKIDLEKNEFNIGVEPPLNIVDKVPFLNEL